MADGERSYEQLASQHDRAKEPRLRDIYLILAADAAQRDGKPAEAERLRLKLLSKNPYHLLRPYTNFADALRSRDVQDYIEDLRLQHPLGAMAEAPPAFAPPEADSEPIPTRRPESVPHARPPSPYAKDSVPLPIQESAGDWNKFVTTILFVVLSAGMAALAAWFVLAPIFGYE